MKLRNDSSFILALGGIILMGLGLYFIFIRPPLLPEDPRYHGHDPCRASIHHAWLVDLAAPRLLGDGRFHVYHWSR